MEMLEIAIRNQDHFGRTLGEVMSALPPGSRSWRCAPGTTTSRPRTGTSSRRTMSCWSSHPSKETLEQVRQSLGEAAPGRVFKDRSDLDYMRVFASRPASWAGRWAISTLPGDRAW